MRAFALVYAVAALVAGLARDAHNDPLPWLGVCLAATGLGLATAAKKPQLMLSAAHAGLTATWAGTLAARQFHEGGYSAPNPAALAMLLMMCAGMAVLIGAGLKTARQKAAREQSSRR